MIKLQIVDDEALVIEWLTNAIAWSEHGIKLIGSAENGAESINLIKSCKPDILLCDISMPVMDGIELAKFIVHNYPEIEIILLSGVKEFDYAYDALNLGITNYILKPCSKEVVLKSVLEAKEKVMRNLMEDKLNSMDNLIQQSSNKTVDKALKYIYKNYKKDISLSEVAENIGVTSTYLSEIFKKETTQNFLTYLTMMKIEMAKKLLMIQSLRVSDISVAVGYNNPGYFSQLFKKYEQITPSQYRLKLFLLNSN